MRRPFLGERKEKGRAPHPTACITTNIGTDVGSIPAKVSENMRPTDTAGLAKDVDEVNQYAAAM